MSRKVLVAAEKLRARAWAELLSVQILVVGVANIQMRTLKVEKEKGFM